MSLDLDQLREGDTVLVRARIVAVHRQADPARSFVSLTLGAQDRAVTADCAALVAPTPCDWVPTDSLVTCRVCGADYAPGWDEARPACPRSGGA